MGTLFCCVASGWLGPTAVTILKLPTGIDLVGTAKLDVVIMKSLLFSISDFFASSSDAVRSSIVEFGYLLVIYSSMLWLLKI